MKKIFMMLTMGLMLAVTGCSGNNQETKSTLPTEVATTMPTETATETQTEESEEDIEEALAVSNDIVVNISGDAQLIASSARYDGDKPVYKKTHIEDWTASSSVYWVINVNKSGKYSVLMYYSAEDGMGGNGEIKIGNDTESFTVKPTGEVDKFKKMTLIDEVYLSSGETTVTISVAADVADSLMNLKRVELTKLSDSVEVSSASDIELLPGNALYSDKDIINEGANIGGWKANGVATWELNVFEAGNYEVVVYHSGDSGTGGIAQISIGAQIVEFEVEPTGGGGTFVDHNVGILSLKQGNNTMKLLPSRMNGEWFMNLERIVLRRVGELNFVTKVSGNLSTLPAVASVTDGPIVENNDSNIGGWKRGGKASWTINVTEVGDYEIVLSRSGGDGTGGPGVLTVGGQTIDLDIVPTGDWGKYEEISLGTVTLAEGETSLVIQASEDAQEYFMNANYINMIKK